MNGSNDDDGFSFQEAFLVMCLVLLISAVVIRIAGWGDAAYDWLHGVF